MDQKPEEDKDKKRSGDDQQQDEHHQDGSSSDDEHTRRAAQEVVLNSIVLLDEKVLERELRDAGLNDSTTNNNSRKPKPKKIRSSPTIRQHRSCRSYSPPRNPLHCQSESNVTSPANPNRVVQFSVTQRPLRHDNNNNNGEANDVNLLNLAAQRSRGVYKDTHTDEEEDEHDLLLKGSAYDPVLAKLRHMDPQRLAELEADSKAHRPSTTTPIPANTDTSSTIIPGAYSASPGMGIQRTPDFRQGVLRHPSADDVTQSTRSSSTAMPDPDAILRTNNSQQDARPMLQSQPEEVISAVRVDEDDLALQIHDEITNAAAQAHVVDLEQETSKLVDAKVNRVRKRYYLYGGLAFCLVLAILTGMVFGILKLKRQVDQDHTVYYQPAPSLSTLDSIRARGYLKCGLTKRDESVTDLDSLEGLVEFTMDICNAFAAAALGGEMQTNNVTFITVTEDERWKALENGTLDVLLVGTPDASESLHWNLDPSIPVQFSTPFVFDGVGFGGMPEFMTNCANSTGLNNFANCHDLKVCLVQGSKSSEIANKRLHPSQVVEVAQLQDVYLRFAEGCCNVIATDYSYDRAEVIVRNMSDYTGPYLFGEGLYTRQPYAAATRKFAWTYHHSMSDDKSRHEDPHVWSAFVNWVIHALIAAEESNITKATAYKFRQTDVFGEEYKDMFRDAIAAVGNYGEIYDRTRALTVPRAGMNMINDGTSGLHYSQSIGNLADFGPPPYENGTLANILRRGKLRCGIAMPRHISAANQTPLGLGPGDLAKMQKELMGPTPMSDVMGTANLDFAYCRALSSAVFQGRLTIDDLTCSVSTHEYGSDDLGIPRPTVDLVVLKDEADGYSQLDAGLIDVMAGFRMDHQSDILEEHTEAGFTFSQPYFYGPSDGHVTDANRCMVTRAHDQQWSDFVHLNVFALFYAEENDCSQAMANDMPVVNRFGPSFKRMMRDAVFAVGNYGEVYDRSVEPVYPRRGTPNELNTESGPQFASMPGLLNDPA